MERDFLGNEIFDCYAMFDEKIEQAKLYNKFLNVNEVFSVRDLRDLFRQDDFEKNRTILLNEIMNRNIPLPTDEKYQHIVPKIQASLNERKKKDDALQQLLNQLPSREEANKVDVFFFYHDVYVFILSYKHRTHYSTRCKKILDTDEEEDIVCPRFYVDMIDRIEGKIDLLKH